MTTKEDLILAKLEALTEEVRELKRAREPLLDLQETLEPILKQVVSEVIERLENMGGRLTMEDIDQLITTSLANTKNLNEGIKLLSSMMELKETAEPILKQGVGEAIQFLDSVTHSFDTEDLGNLTRQALLNIGNLGEAMQILSAAMEMKRTVGEIPKLMVDELIEKLEDFRQRGGFVGLEKLAAFGERFACGMAQVDLDKTQPITGIFGMLGALKRPEVQRGLGVAMELAAALGQQPSKG